MKYFSPLKQFLFLIPVIVGAREWIRTTIEAKPLSMLVFFAQSDL